MTLNLMSSNLSMKIKPFMNILLLGIALALFLSGCDFSQLNNPYAKSDGTQSVLYSSFSERPKHLDPAISYSSNEFTFIGQIYEPPYQYHYLKRPYQLVPLTAKEMPQVQYLGANGQVYSSMASDERVAYTEYTIEIKPGIMYQPHPALATDDQGTFLYHQLTKEQLGRVSTLSDFESTGTRELTAEDYVYQIKRLASPKIQSPIAELMKNYIVGFEEFYQEVLDKDTSELVALPMAGVSVVNKYQYKIRIKGKYPQFRFWLAMPFFAPMPWEAEVFFNQPGLKEKNITLDWYPLGTGPYLMQENNPNRHMVMVKNPNFHFETYPDEGEPNDEENGLLKDAGKQLPFIDKVIYTLEKETIPYWNKFLQGYYDASGIASDSFDQAIQFSGAGEVGLTPDMKEKGIQLNKAVTTSIFYMGFNMLDPIVGRGEKARKLRQAIAIAVDYEEFISIFMNGRGIVAQGILPPGIFGYEEGQDGINPYVYQWRNNQPERKDISVAKKLMRQAGFTNGKDPKTGEALILYFDTTSSSIDDRARMNWFRKQFKKLGIKLVIRGTDYNRFQQKMRAGNAQIFMWGWNADYPDPENFFFLLYGPNGKVKHGGENAANYRHPYFDREFRKMRGMDDNDKRFRLIRNLQIQLRHDSPWLFGFHPEDFVLVHSWYKNLKPNLMANNRLKYIRVDTQERIEKRQKWNKPVFWPLIFGVLLLLAILMPAIMAYRKRVRYSVH